MMTPTIAPLSRTQTSRPSVLDRLSRVRYAWNASGVVGTVYHG